MGRGAGRAVQAGGRIQCEIISGLVYQGIKPKDGWGPNLEGILRGLNFILSPCKIMESFGTGDSKMSRVFNLFIH